jgi:hypothetical protein
MKSAPGVLRKTTASAISSGLATRLKGVDLVMVSISFSVLGDWERTAWSSGVSVKPGQTTLTLILYLATSRATDLEKAMTAPFAPE